MRLFAFASNSPSGSCEQREQTYALVAMGSAFLLALATVIAAILLGSIGGSVNDASSLSLGGGLGGGVGGGIGSGVGTGSSNAGTGSGAGKVGRGKSASGDDASGVPAGSNTGTVVADTKEKGATLAKGAATEPPKWGFTKPDKSDPVDPPAGRAALGDPKGRGGEGRAGAGGGGKAAFMGINAEAKRIVYVVDFTKSMDEEGRIDRAKSELMRSIHDLPPDASFAVVIFSTPDDKSIQMPPEGVLVPATASAKSSAGNWVKAQPTLDGATTPSDAMERALRLNPEAIFFLTDGGFYSIDAQRLFERIATLNKDHKIAIHTVALHTEDGAHDLKQIAEENGGTYRFVPKP